jgi:hypothetical protein
MAEALEHGLRAASFDVDSDEEPLPEIVVKHLKRARHLHKRAKRAPAGSNNRSKALEVRDEHIKAAVDHAAAEGIDIQRIPKWAIDRYPPED